MFFIAGMGDKLKLCGTLKGRCPNCNRIVLLNISKSYGYFHAFFVPVLKFHVQYLATCPHCACTMELSPARGREFERTGDTVVVQGDFAKMDKAFFDPMHKFCLQCGHTLSPGDRFCPNCASPTQTKAH